VRRKEGKCEERKRDIVEMFLIDREFSKSGNVTAGEYKKIRSHGI
jgi:hypothetical protein